VSSDGTGFSQVNDEPSGARRETDPGKGTIASKALGHPAAAPHSSDVSGRHRLRQATQQSPAPAAHRCCSRAYLRPYDRTVRRRPIDWDEVRRNAGEQCFICELVAGNPEYRHCVIYEDEIAVAFLNRYPALFGHVLVAPREHREQVTGDFSPDEYVALQRRIWRISEAIRRVVRTERLYILSLGSQQGNRHVHWHLAPLPPGVPIAEQQFAALDRSDIADVTDAEMLRLATQLRNVLGVR
jgi:diadenosine tetraphosphate (Ap4A) HIT family hydrolase